MLSFHVLSQSYIGTCGGISQLYNDEGCCSSESFQQMSAYQKCYKGQGTVIGSGGGGGRMELSVVSEKTILASVGTSNIDMNKQSTNTVSGYQSYNIQDGLISKGSESCTGISTQIMTADEKYVWGIPKYRSFGIQRQSRTDCSITSFDTSTIKSQNWLTSRKAQQMMVKGNYVYVLTQNQGTGSDQLLILKFDKSMTGEMQVVRAGKYISGWSGANRFTASDTHIYVHSKAGLESIPFDFKTGDTFKVETTYEDKYRTFAQYGMNFIDGYIYSWMIDFNIYRGVYPNSELFGNVDNTPTGHFVIFDTNNTNTQPTLVDIVVPEYNMDSASESNLVVKTEDGSIVSYFVGKINSTYGFTKVTRLSHPDDMDSNSTNIDKFVLIEQPEMPVSFLSVDTSQFAGGASPVYINDSIVYGFKDGVSLQTYNVNNNKNGDNYILGAELIKPYSQVELKTCGDLDQQVNLEDCCDAVSKDFGKDKKCFCYVPEPAPIGSLKVTLKLDDSYGDSWDGATLEITGGFCGKETFSLGRADGKTKTFETFFPPNSCMDIVYKTGSYPEEQTFKVTLGEASTEIISGRNTDFTTRLCYDDTGRRLSSFPKKQTRNFFQRPKEDPR